MDVYFDTQRLQSLCNSRSKLVKKYGHRVADNVQARLQQLESVESLDDLRPLPGGWHMLTANLAGLWAADLAGRRNTLRLIVKEEAHPEPDVVLSEVTTVALVVKISEHYKDL